MNIYARSLCIYSTNIVYIFTGLLKNYILLHPITPNPLTFPSILI